jgi:CYTH domain-containing protein
MALEIERRFLLKHVPDIKYDKELLIVQYYMKDGYRLRSQSDYNTDKTIYYKTFKKATDNPMVDEEMDVEISVKEFNKLYKPKKVLRSIVKDRNVKFLDKDGLKFEIDNFQDGLAVVIAEIEIPTIDYDLVLPDYIQKVLLLEVTEYRQFKNYNLAE